MTYLVTKLTNSITKLTRVMQWKNYLNHITVPVSYNGLIKIVNKWSTHLNNVISLSSQNFIDIAAISTMYLQLYSKHFRPFL